MSSLDELMLFSSACWRAEDMLDGTKYASMKKLAEQLRRAAGQDFSAGYYVPETLPYMLAFREACLLHGSKDFFSRGKSYSFNIIRLLHDTTPTASVLVCLPRFKHHTELAHLFEYDESRKKCLLLRIAPRMLVYVQLIVECFRRAGVLPSDFALGWRYLVRDDKAKKLSFAPNTELVCISRDSPEQLVRMGRVGDVDIIDREIQMPVTGEPLRFSFHRYEDGNLYLSIDVTDWNTPRASLCGTMWDLL